MSALDRPIGERFPERWQITSVDVLAGDPEAIERCPSPGSILISFVITNAIVMAVSLVVGYRPFIHAIIPCLGQKKPNRIKFAWVLPLVTHLLANAIIGALIHHTPGYSHVGVVDVMMLYLIRPRIAVIVLFWATALFRVNNEYPWLASLIGNAVTELLLQIAALAWVLATSIQAHYSENRGLVIGMVIAGCAYLVGFLILIFVTRPADATGQDIKDNNYHGIRTSDAFFHRFMWAVFLMIFLGPSYLLNWIFFAGIVTYAKEE